MKNLKVKLSALALLVGATAAFAGANNKMANRKWTRDAASGIYSPVNGTKGVDYLCDESANTCTETYLQTVDPNTNPPAGEPGHVAPISTELGDFQ